MVLSTERKESRDVLLKGVECALRVSRIEDPSTVSNYLQIFVMSLIAYTE